MIFDPFLRSIVLGTAMLAGAGLAAAAEQIVVKTNESKMLDLTGSPGTIVVGNPSIADVSLHGQKLFLHGRGFGTTNVIILDDQGSQLIEYEVSVQQGGSNNLALYKAGESYSFVCTPLCEGALHIGDSDGFFKKTIAGQTGVMIGLATGQKQTDTKEAAPTQE